MAKRARNYPLPPWSYSSDGVEGLIPPSYALVGKPICDADGRIITFHLVLENTATGKPATAQEMNAFMQAITDAFANLDRC